MTFDVPIVILAFNRPETTRVVFEAVRRMAPQTLLLVLDAPREGRPEDIAKCDEVRRILNSIDWPCRVFTDIATQNMGARRRVSTGLTWAFSNVERAIVLEDDCVPSVDFFHFCDVLLEQYRDDHRVMHIGGTNLAPRSTRATSSYVFSRYALSWGWATWRRAWRLYDDELSMWPAVRAAGWLRDYFADDVASFDKWTHRLDAVRRNEFDSWASVWMFSCWMQNALSIIPVENQIENIGLGDPDATHTSGVRHVGLTRPTAPISFPLQHPEIMVRDAETDRHLAARPLMIKDYSGISGQLRRLKAMRLRRKDDMALPRPPREPEQFP